MPSWLLPKVGCLAANNRITHWKRIPSPISSFKQKSTFPQPLAVHNGSKIRPSDMARRYQAFKDRSTMTEPGTASWDVSISEADFAKLIAGVESQCMEDKWNVWSEAGCHGGDMLVHFARSWTGQKVYILHLEANDGDGNTGGKIKGITWAQKLGRIHISEEQGKRDVTIMSRALLGCKVEALPEYDSSDLYKPASTDAFKERQRQEQGNGSGNKPPV